MNLSFRKIFIVNMFTKKNMLTNQPLADRMRPNTLEGYIGQDHIIGENSILKQSIDIGTLPSFILWGPPGVGKTTLAKIISNTLDRTFYNLSAINSGVKEVRETIESAKKQQFFNTPNPILFIDEIHRFSKSQQDSLLGAVESGIITLIGATTENPSFEVISPLLSRCQVFVLKHLDKNHMLQILQNALKKDHVLNKMDIELQETDALMRYSGGDGRKLLNILELVTSQSAKNKSKIVITNDSVTNILKENMAMYDKSGEMHYDVISAFIKSIRGSDPNAGVYWLARMIEGGEDPKFIARRLVILAAEDIGLANPNALLIANQTFEAINRIGWPESRIILSEATIYLANSPKSNSAYQAINEAQALVKKTGDLSVPLHLRNAPTSLMKELDYGKGYKYSHDYEGHFVQQDFLPKEIKGEKIYLPGSNPQESKYLSWLKKAWNKVYNY